MTTQPKILVFAGSLRKDSYNKKLARIAAEDAKKAGAQVTYIDLADYPLPIYCEDLETNEGIPPNALKLKELFFNHDGFIICSPEYNSSISGVLKNTIDWISRPASANEVYLSCFTDKVALLLSASVGALGGLRGLVHLRAILQNIFMHVIPGQKCISKANEAFDDQGQLKSAEQKEVIQDLCTKLVETTRRLANK